MADPTTPITPIPSFNLNLEPSTETPVAPQVPESVEKTNDDRLQKEDKLVEDQTKVEDVVETKTESAPVVEETPVIEIAQIVPEIKIEEAKVETVVEAPAPVIETPAPVVETPVVEAPAPVVEAPAPVVEAPAPVVEIPAPVVEIPAPATPSATLQKDLQIIQNIQQTPATTAQVAPTVAPVQIPLTPTANSFNLDNISAQIPAAPQMPGINTPMGNIPTAPNIAANPYDNLSNYIPQIAPGQVNTAPISTIKKSSKTGAEIGIGVGVGFLVLAWFVVKTMYPIQYKDAMGGLFGTSEDSISTVITTSLTGSDMTGDNILSGELASGDISFGTGNSILLSGTVDSGAINEITGDHNAAADSGSLIDVSATPTMSMDDFKAKIEAYASQGKIATLKAKKTGDKQLITNSLAMYKKAEATLQDIANGKEITTDNMNSIITEISGYLNTTNPIADATPSTTEKPTNTGSSDFNPDAFFGSSGSSQN